MMGSSQTGAKVSSVMYRARCTVHSSVCSMRMAPTRRRMAASFGKIPTTSVLRLISPFKRSIGFVECNLDVSRFDAAPLIAFIAAKETNYGNETHGRIPR